MTSRVIRIRRCAVVRWNTGPDMVFLRTELDDPTPGRAYISLRFESPRGTGIDYLRDVLGVEDKYIDIILQKGLGVSYDMRVPSKGDESES